MMRSQSRRNTLRVGLADSGCSRPRLLSGSDAYAARGAGAATTMPSIQLTEGLLALTYWASPIATHGFTMEHVTVSERAARRIGEILRREAPGAGLRGRVEGGGCSGVSYKVELERERAADDIAVVRDGA